MSYKIVVLIQFKIGTSEVKKSEYFADIKQETQNASGFLSFNCGLIDAEKSSGEVNADFTYGFEVEFDSEENLQQFIQLGQYKFIYQEIIDSLQELIEAPSYELEDSSYSVGEEDEGTEDIEEKKEEEQISTKLQDDLMQITLQMQEALDHNDIVKAKTLSALAVELGAKAKEREDLLKHQAAEAIFKKRQTDEKRRTAIDRGNRYKKIVQQAHDREKELTSFLDQEDEKSKELIKKSKKAKRMEKIMTAGGVVFAAISSGPFAPFSIASEIVRGRKEIKKEDARIRDEEEKIRKHDEWREEHIDWELISRNGTHGPSTIATSLDGVGVMEVLLSKKTVIQSQLEKNTDLVQIAELVETELSGKIEEKTLLNFIAVQKMKLHSEAIERLNQKLLMACEENDEATVIWLLSLINLSDSTIGIDVDYNNTVTTPLFSAERNGHLNIIKLLIQAGAKLNIELANYLLIHDAVIHGKLDILDYLLSLDRNFLNQRTSKGYTLLHLAVQTRQYSIADFLLQLGADVNLEEYTKQFTPLHTAVGLGEILFIQLLCKYHGELERKNQAGQTPLWMALLNQDIGAVKVLCQNQANIESLYNGIRALSQAIIQNNSELVSALLAFKPNLETMDERQNTYLILAAEKRFTEIMQLLLQAGANARVKVEGKIELIMFGVQHSWPDVVQILVQHDRTLLNGQDDTKTTPLHLATEREDKDMVQLLLMLGADASIENAKGYSPLFIAQRNGYREIVSMIEKENIKKDYTSTPMTTYGLFFPCCCIERTKTIDRAAADLVNRFEKDELFYVDVEKKSIFELKETEMGLEVISSFDSLEYFVTTKEQKQIAEHLKYYRNQAEKQKLAKIIYLIDQAARLLTSLTEKEAQDWWIIQDRKWKKAISKECKEIRSYLKEHSYYTTGHPTLLIDRKKTCPEVADECIEGCYGCCHCECNDDCNCDSSSLHSSAIPPVCIRDSFKVPIYLKPTTELRKMLIHFSASSISEWRPGGDYFIDTHHCAPGCTCNSYFAPIVCCYPWVSGFFKTRNKSENPMVRAALEDKLEVIHLFAYRQLFIDKNSLQQALEAAFDMNHLAIMQFLLSLRTEISEKKDTPRDESIEIMRHDQHSSSADEETIWQSDEKIRNLLEMAIKEKNVSKVEILVAGGASVTDSDISLAQKFCCSCCYCAASGRILSLLKSSHRRELDESLLSHDRMLRPPATYDIRSSVRI